MADTLIRPARADEMWDIHAWRNAEHVRKAMLTQHEIGREEHAAWFERKMADPAFRQMIVEHNGTPVAVQAFFDIKPGDTAWWAFYFTPAVPDDMAAMMRIWKWVELAGIAYAFGPLGLQTLYCEVLRTNAGVLNWHKRFGFSPCDPGVSVNSAAFDLEVLSFTRENLAQFLAGRQGSDLKAVAVEPHRFDA